MFEPTESEPNAELGKIAAGVWPREDNPLRNSPHTAEGIAGDWRHAYTRKEVAHPLPSVRAHKYWPPVKRVDQAFGDRHFFCACPVPEAWID